jgi:tetratricopeptide (TPR) repeat protein
LCCQNIAEYNIIATIKKAFASWHGRDKKVSNYSKENDKNSVRITPYQEDELIDLGVKESFNGNHAQSLKYFDEVVKANPNNVRARSNRAASKILLKDYRGAIEDASMSIKLYPQRGVAYYNRALAYVCLKEYELALDDLNAYIEIGNFNTRWGVNRNPRFIIYWSLDKYKDAADAYIYAKSKMSSERIKELDIYYLIGLTYEKIGSFETAKQYYRTAAELYSRQAAEKLKEISNDF